MSEEPTMSGALVGQHRRVLTTMCGEERFQRVLAALSPSMREEYDAANPLSWVRVATAERVFELAGRELGRNPAELHEAVSRDALEHTLTKLWRFVLRFVSDEALIARSPLLYNRAFQRGRLEAKMVGPGRAEIRIIGWPDMPEFSLRGLRIAIETVLRLSGREQARLTQHRASEGQMFVATWAVRSREAGG